jgi:hypothetical protein
MNVTRNVILDLLPAYVSGEASTDTKLLVEEFLLKDPELGRVATSLELTGSALRENEDTHPVDAIEKDAFVRSRSLLRQRAWTFGLALFCTLAPLTTHIQNGELAFQLLRDVPGAWLLWVGAGILWIRYRRLDGRVRPSGL